MLPEELLQEIYTYLPVDEMIRLRCIPELDTFYRELETHGYREEEFIKKRCQIVKSTIGDIIMITSVIIDSSKTILWGDCSSYLINDDNSTTLIEKSRYSCNIKLYTVKYHSNGNKFYIVHLDKDQKIHGVSTTFYKDGVTYIIANFHHGKLNGDRRTFYPNGKLQLYEQYMMGKLEGEYINYDINGNITEKSIYKSDKKEGPYIKYYDNGNVEILGQFENNFQTESWHYYDISGKLIQTKDYHEFYVR